MRMAYLSNKWSLIYGIVPKGESSWGFDKLRMGRGTNYVLHIGRVAVVLSSDPIFTGAK